MLRKKNVFKVHFKNYIEFCVKINKKEISNRFLLIFAGQQMLKFEK
jgi:hypothetical protein